MSFVHKLFQFTMSMLLVLATSQTLQAQSYPSEIAAWSDATKQAQRDAAKKMMADLDTAIKRGDKVIKIPKAHYRFDKLIGGRRPMHIHWRELNSVTLDFQGSTFWYENPRAGIVMSKCRNSKLTNLYMDWDPLPFVQGRIMAIDHATQRIHVKLDQGYDQPVNDFTKVQNHWRGMIFDPKTRQLKPQVIGFALDVKWKNRTPEGYQIVKLNGFYGIKLNASGISVGDDIVLLRRMGRGMRIENCENNTLENVTMYSCPFVTFAQNFGRGSATFRNVNILRRPNTNRLISSNADGINVGNMQHGPLLENCRMEYLGDDFVNIHSAYNRVVWQNSPTEVVSSLINGYAAKDANGGKPVEILFFNRKTMKQIGKRNVIKVTTNNSYPVNQDKCLFNLKSWFHSGIASQFRQGAKTARANIITLDKPIEITGDVVTTLPDYISAGGIVRNCHFVGSLARGIRLQAPKAIIENNHIENTMGYGISMCGQPSYWGEGPYVHSTVARNNKLINCSQGPANRNNPAIMVQQSGDYTQSDTQYDIAIENNLIQNCGAMGIMVRGVKGLKLTGNTIDGYYKFKVHPQRKPMPKEINGTGYGIVIESCENITRKNNTVSQPGPFAKGDVFEARNK